ncbi:reverse transcriptase domain-containing protein [Tanacetum coccineum]
MTDSQSSEEGVRRVILEFRVTGPHLWSVASFLPSNGHPSTTLVSQIGNTSRMVDIKPNKRPGLKKKPYPSSLPEQIFASATQQMSQIQKRSSRKQNLSANRKGKHKSINGKRSEKAEQTKEEGKPEDTVQPPPIPLEKDNQTDENFKGKDEHPERPLESKPPKKVVIHDDYPDQTVTIGGNLSAECRSGLIKILRKHVDAFTWNPTYMTEIPRFIIEYELKTYPHIKPRVQRKRSIAPDKRKVVKEEVAEWLKARIEETFIGQQEQKSIPVNKELDRRSNQTLTAPKKEKELMVYLSAANEAVSAVLLVERDGRQAPIHYVEGSYEAKSEKTKKYKEKALEMTRGFNNFQISHIPREDDKKADALSKLAAMQCGRITKTWMTADPKYIEHGILPEDVAEARTIREKARNYTMEEGVL